MNKILKSALAGATLALGTTTLVGVVDAEPAEHPVCQRTDSGWSVVPYDDANGSWTKAVLPYNGACPKLDVQGELEFVKPTPAPGVQTHVYVKTVVRTKVVTKKIVIRNGKRTVTRKVVWR